MSSFEIELNGKRVTADEFLESEIKRLTELYPPKQEIETAREQTTMNQAKQEKTILAKDKRPRNQMGLDQFFDRKQTTIISESKNLMLSKRRMT